jgi:Phage terminase large subunit
MNIDIPVKFKKLVLSNKRFKVAHGGRGGAKTTSFATIFILKSMERTVRILCCREIMNSIQQSVYETLTKRIKDLQLQDKFDVYRDSIECKATGSRFIFAGLYRNIETLKGLEDVDYVWISEADTVSEKSLQTLYPSIRKQGSQIWLEFNPRYDDDAVYKRYIANPDPDAEVIFVNWNDNPFISQTLIAQKDSDYARLPNEAPHIWEGKIKNYGGFIWTPPFDPAIHIRDFKWHQIPTDRVNIIQALDPHQHYYPASIWIALIKQSSGTVYRWAFAEWPTFGTFGDYYANVRKKIPYEGSLLEMSAKFKTIEADIPHKVNRRYIDSRFSKGIGGPGWSAWTSKTEGIVESWRRPENGGLNYVCPREGIIDIQRSAIKAAMSYNTSAAVNELNEPTFFVSPACKNLIQSLRNHRLEQDSEKEVDNGLKDFSDSLRIGFAGLHSWVWVSDESARMDEFPRQHSGGNANSWQGI